MKSFRFAAVAALFAALFLSCVDKDANGGDIRIVLDKDTGRYGNFEGLDAETEKQIVHDFFNQMINKEFYSKATVQGIRVENYYGTYNGIVAVTIEDNITEYDTPTWVSPDWEPSWPSAQEGPWGLRTPDFSTTPDELFSERISWMRWLNPVLLWRKEYIESDIFTKNGRTNFMYLHLAYDYNIISREDIEKLVGLYVKYYNQKNGFEEMKNENEE